MTTPTLSRRTVLKAAAAGLPAWLAAESRADDPPKPAEKPKVALIGCGGQGRGIAASARRFGAVVAVCDVDAKRAADAAKQFGGAKAYADFRKLLDAGTVRPDERTVLVMTGTGLKSTERFAALLGLSL